MLHVYLVLIASSQWVQEVFWSSFNFGWMLDLFVKYFCRFFETHNALMGIQISNDWNSHDNSFCDNVFQIDYSNKLAQIICDGSKIKKLYNLPFQIRLLAIFQFKICISGQLFGLFKTKGDFKLTIKFQFAGHLFFLYCVLNWYSCII